MSFARSFAYGHNQQYITADRSGHIITQKESLLKPSLFLPADIFQ